MYSSYGKRFQVIPNPLGKKCMGESYAMGGLDLGDALIGQYEPQFRGLKLWKKILFSFLMMASGRFMNAIFQTFEFIFVNTYNCLHHMKSALYV